MQNIFNFLANPSRFRVFSEKSYPYAMFIMIILIFLGLWYSLFNSPPDYQQGETVRIMYVNIAPARAPLYSSSKDLTKVICPI